MVMYSAGRRPACPVARPRKRRPHPFAGVLLCLAGAARADVVTYEADVYPEEAGWDRVGTSDADRALRDGWLAVAVDLGVWDPVPGGEQDFYLKPIPEFTGGAFFVQWRCITDAPNSETPGGGGITLNAWGIGVINHFRITGGQLRIWRGNTLPFVFVDIEPGIPHTYRIETHVDNQYVHYVDGQMVDSGVLLGAFPNADSRIIWGSSMWFFENATRWDYIRYGTIPIDGSGDFDSDTTLDVDDFYFFQECVANGGPQSIASPGCLFADMDQDGNVDLHDFALFQRAFTASE